MVTAQPGATTVSLAKFEVGKVDERREVSPRVADVIRVAEEMGATYPDIVQMLADASKQKNLPTRLAADELPESGRAYYRPSADPTKPGSRQGTKVGRDNFTPNLFPAKDEPEERTARNQNEQKNKSATGNMAGEARKDGRGKGHGEERGRELGDHPGVVEAGDGATA